MRAVAGVLAAIVLCSLTSLAQASQKAPDGNAVCTFEDGKQVSVRYPEVQYGKSKLPNGKIWEPGDRPMYLFTQTDLQLGSQAVPPGAYSLYPVPGDQQWTLVVNKEVEQGKPYDASKDLAKLTAQTGELPNAANALTLYFGRIGPKKCTLRIDYGKQRAFADIAEK